MTILGTLAATVIVISLQQATPRRQQSELLLPEEAPFSGSEDQGLLSTTSSSFGGASNIRTYVSSPLEPDSPPCPRNSTSPLCSSAKVYVLAEGGLEARIHAICSAYAVKGTTNFTAQAIWVQDDELMPTTAFADLFRPLSFVHDSKATARQWRKHLHESQASHKSLSFSLCTNQGSRKALLFSAFLIPGNPRFPGFHLSLGCAMARHYRRCFVDLQPSAAVSRLIESEPQRGRLWRSAAAFVDTVTSGADCRGCPGNEPMPEVCMMRRLTQQFLMEPSRDFTLGALMPAHAAGIAKYFHPSRAPLILGVTEERAAKCPHDDVWRAEWDSTLLPTPARVPSPRNLSMEKRRLLWSEEEGREGAQLAQQLAAAAVADRDKKGSPVGFFEVDDARRKAIAEAAAAADVRTTKGGRAFPLDTSGGDVAACVRLQAAELFLLAEASGIIPTNHSSISSLFVASRGSARNSAFRTGKRVCQAFPIRPIIKQRFAMFVIIEEKLKLVYCAIPKVAVTSWLMWLRAQLGLNDPRNPWLALHAYDSGLHQLAIHFTERQAVNLITRPDFYKFTFVRNPFSRAVSAYNNKLVKSDTPGNKTGPGSRSYWNWAFFRHVQAQFDAVKKREDLVSFRDFTRLVGAVMQTQRWAMDRHIAPQVDICNLNAIKYDFVGRFENLQEDVGKVANRHNGKHLDVFNFGRHAHYTNATGTMAKLYDQQSYDAIKRIYALDFHVALNNISFEPPEVLRRRFE